MPARSINYFVVVLGFSVFLKKTLWDELCHYDPFLHLVQRFRQVVDILSTVVDTFIAIKSSCELMMERMFSLVTILATLHFLLCYVGVCWHDKNGVTYFQVHDVPFVRSTLPVTMTFMTSPLNMSLYNSIFYNQD